MPSPIRIRSKEEKRLIDTATALLNDPTATTADKFKAMGYLERAIRLAEKRRIRRAEDADWYPPAEPQAEQSVDDLVTELEKGQKHPPQPIAAQELTELEKAGKASEPIAPVVAPSEPAKASEVTQTVPAPATAFCAFCDATGKWNTRYPLDETAPKRVLLCPTCFGKMVSMDMLAAQSEARARAETPPDWAGEFAAKRNLFSSDFEKSRALWAEQDRDAADQREQEAREHAQAEAQYNRTRADWIANGGRL
jgi:hypothetical protein